MWTAAAPDRCMTLSGLHQRVIGKALDYVTWTAARLCENWWTRLQTIYDKYKKGDVFWDTVYVCVGVSVVSVNVCRVQRSVTATLHNIALPNALTYLLSK